ncbi:hypothetical protein [Microtetraspora sp. NBRC 13810]|uniref:hypothetical protein n=1 Tax=Microtetraspora sp. NBRC 13810 TaxID=3030990 RepID=UPI0025573FC5|nr:hypothetical protein [Microtetraspora sp. NBRC 13810]
MTYGIAADVECAAGRPSGAAGTPAVREWATSATAPQATTTAMTTGVPRGGRSGRRGVETRA